METNKKMKLLLDTKKIFEENNIEFFPQGGTLLGFVREEQIIPWDPDIDLFAYYDDYNKIISLKKNFEKSGYKLHFSPGKIKHCSICYPEDYSYFEKDWKAHELYCKKNKLPIGYDVPFHIGIDLLTRDKDKMIVLRFFDKNIFNKLFGKLGKRLSRKYHEDVVLKNKKQSGITKLIGVYNFLSRLYSTMILFTRKHRVMPYDWFKNKKKMKIYNSYFDVPSNPEGYVELVYGSDWRNPEKDWSSDEWKKSTQYIRKYKVRDKKVRNLFIKRGDIKY